jgi:hypothetical protein
MFFSSHTGHPPMSPFLRNENECSGVPFRERNSNPVRLRHRLHGTPLAERNVIFNAEFTALDSVYNWQVVVTNQYYQSDTLRVRTVVEPFPDRLRCR